MKKYIFLFLVSIAILSLTIGLAKAVDVKTYQGSITSINYNDATFILSSSPIVKVEVNSDTYISFQSGENIVSKPFSNLKIGMVVSVTGSAGINLSSNPTIVVTASEVKYSGTLAVVEKPLLDTFESSTTHNECRNERCYKMSGSGDNQCYIDSECRVFNSVPADDQLDILKKELIKQLQEQLKVLQAQLQDLINQQKLLNNCAKEGEAYSSVFKNQYPEHCCAGLTEWMSGMDTSKVSNGQCLQTGSIKGSPVGTCIKCGDGICGARENVCNCLQDCKVIPNFFPVIDDVIGSTSLKVKETGTWTIKAYDPENGNLNYIVKWGDELSNTNLQSIISVTKQTITFTHTYTWPGNFTVEFIITDDKNQTTRITKTVLVTDSTVYSMGGPGQGGGIIFYDKGSYSNGWRYLEAALSDQGSPAWGCDMTNISGASNTIIGTGHQNTHDMIAAGCTSAILIHGTTINNYSDWFLPSKDELNLVYSNLKVKGVGDFIKDAYWSSSEYDNLYAWLQDFNNGGVYYGRKSDIYYIRAIRAF